MYSRKSLGPRIKPWGSPALTGYSCEDFSSRTTWSYLLLREEEIRRNIWPEIAYDLSLWKRPACQTLSKTSDIQVIQLWSGPSPVKSPSNSISYNCQKICSWLKRPKTILEIRKTPHFYRWSKIYCLQVFQRLYFTNNR